MDVLTKRYPKQGAKKTQKTLNSAARKTSVFFLSSVTSKGFHPRREKSKARTHPKAFPRSPLSLSTIEREKGREIKIIYPVVDDTLSGRFDRSR